jgi:hypothetical protein
MDVTLSRLRRGEYLVGASSVLLLASMFALHWYGLKGRLAPTAAQLGQSTTLDGWQTLTHVRWLLLVSVLLGVMLVFFQVTRQAPAIPVTLSVLVTVFGLLSVLALIDRVVLSPPGSGLLSVKIGAILGLASALGMTAGGYLSMRDEGIAPADAPAEIELVKLPETGRS